MNGFDASPDLIPIAVWDRPVRQFHWLLAACVTVAAITAWVLPANWLSLHIAAGSAIAALLFLRVIWGFTGPYYSRFRSFSYPVSHTLAHVGELLTRRGQRSLGHNPVGALMVFTLLAVLVGLTLSGVIVLGGELKQGPLKGVLSYSAGRVAHQFHEFIAFGLAALVAGHVAGVIFESLRTRENLVTAMITGYKRGTVWEQTFVSVVISRPMLAIALGAIGIASASGLAIWGCGFRAAGVPPLAADPSWQKECSACHIAFHPSLLPAASWETIINGLARHFGEDASLDPAQTAEIKAYLIANSAEHWDTRPGNRQRQIDPARPLEITATPFWTRMHGHISEAAFTRRSVGGKQNCAACHSDAASGMFAPQAISVPKEDE